MKLPLVLIFIALAITSDSFGMDCEKICKINACGQIIFSSKKGDEIILGSKSKKDNAVEIIKSDLKSIRMNENPEKDFNDLEEAYVLQEQEKNKKAN